MALDDFLVQNEQAETVDQAALASARLATIFQARGLEVRPRPIGKRSIESLRHQRQVADGVDALVADGRILRIQRGVGIPVRPPALRHDVLEFQASR